MPKIFSGILSDVHTGRCPANGPDCEALDSGNATKTCGGELYSSDYDCPYLYRCCNGTCKKAVPSEPG